MDADYFRRDEIFKNSQAVHILVYLNLITDANGCVTVSVNQISEETGISVQTVRTCLKKLELTNKLTRESINQKTLITLQDTRVLGGRLRRTNKDSNKQTNKVLPMHDYYPFDAWWDLYDKKVERPKCVKVWKTLSDEVKATIMDHTKQYVKSTPNKKYRKNPLTYLHRESWSDEIINEAERGWRTYTNNTDYSEERSVIDVWNKH